MRPEHRLQPRRLLYAGASANLAAQAKRSVSNSQRVIGGSEIGQTGHSRLAVQQEARQTRLESGLWILWGGGRADGTPSVVWETDVCPALLLHPTETVRRRLLATASLMIYLTTASPATYRDSQLDPGTLQL